MKEWPLQEAKAKLSELIRVVHLEGTQKVTVHGKNEVYILRKKDYEKLTKKNDKSWLEFVSKSPLKGIALNITRKKNKSRKIDL